MALIDKSTKKIYGILDSTQDAEELIDILQKMTSTLNCMSFIKADNFCQDGLALVAYTPKYLFELHSQFGMRTVRNSSLV